MLYRSFHGQEAKTDLGEKADVKAAPEEASKHKKAQSQPRLFFPHTCF